jgi:hypothetical protein
MFLEAHMHRGWVKLYRKLSDNKLWTSEKFSRGQAWIDLLMLANHKDAYIYARGVKLTVKRGQVGWSIKKLGERWQWSPNKVRKFLKDLENEHQIEHQKNNVSTIITIINYHDYQSEELQKEYQKNTRRTAEEPQKNTNNNDKNVNNDKNDKKGKRFTPPSLEEVSEYCKERNNSVDPEKFIAFYNSKGWKVGNQSMKSWKDSVITWEKRDKAKPKKVYI